ncbi:MAG: hypothetical protein L6R40_006591 [Gallowayella cf. fulva]|nr:MAG: hypothetical protein L6R40_006591 [Xanthomendoza cf. fulva]
MDFRSLRPLSDSSQLLLGGLILVAAYYIVNIAQKYQARNSLILQHNCKPPTKYPVWDPFFGIDVVYNAIGAIKRKTFINEKISHYNTYGNTHSSRLTTYPVISTIEPENIKTVLSTHFKDFVIGSPRRRAFGPVIANSVLVADGVEWEHARAFLKPSFARSQVGDLATLETHVKHLIDAIPTDGSTVDLAELFLRYTADVTTDFMFGESILSLPHPESFGGDLTDACRVGQLGAERRFRLGIFENLVPQGEFYRAVGKVHSYMETHVDKAIQQRRSQPEDAKDAGMDNGRHIFLNELVKMTDDRMILRDQLLGIFLVGRDTTAALLTNLFFVLAREPDIWKRLHEDIISLNGQKPTLEGVKGLKYLSSCLNESKYIPEPYTTRSNANLPSALRLYPIVQGNSRVATKDVILPTGGGEDGRSPVFVSAGTLVIFHFVALHKRKDLWGEDADDFRPERWEDEKA